ncbi:MAG: ATP-dependent DNA helicase RecG [Spirochaeta sp.]
MLLAELNTSVTKLRGVGPNAASDLSGMGVHSVRDLLLLIPRDYEDRKTIYPLLPHGESAVWVNTIAEVTAHDYFQFQGKMTLKVHIFDGKGHASLVCFGRNFLSRKLQVGRRYHVCGQFSIRYGEFQSSAFDTEPADEAPQRFNRILPIYPLSGSLQQGRMRSLLQLALQQFADNIDPSLPASIARGTAETLRGLHDPDSIQTAVEARESMAYEELFFLQAQIAHAVAQRSAQQRPQPQRPVDLQQRMLESLPFSLTPDQQQAVEETTTDLQKQTPMRRLLHGDVGSGKTLAALCSALPVIAGGGQVVLLVPTELLAQQHARTAAAQLNPLGISTALLSGSISAADRTRTLQRIRSGETQFICATHAAFSRDVEYAALEYVIVDEQHRFGVEQRQQLIRKAEQSGSSTGPPDVLFMTATPIPRTLALTVFGDLDVSAIRSMPPGRRPIKTHLARLGNEQKVYEWVRGELRQGRQAYFVYPLINESKKLAIRDAESMAEHLAAEVFPDNSLGIIHSQTPTDKKEHTMAGFNSGRIQILVATSVVEVGVDVPNATCMVIEHAERFGLAALHQLRGRVGRGVHQSYCFLIYAEPLTDEAKQRIMVMKQHTDGFKIAEEDLNIRGPGDLSGIRQAGFLRFRAARLPQDMGIMNRARQDAFRIIQSDPDLSLPEHESIRNTLQHTALHDNAAEGEY